MNYVHESLNMFQDDKFFKQLNEGKEDKKEAAELEKQGMMVIKKVMDNFNRFKAAAGDKVKPYSQFWQQQLDVKEGFSFGDDAMIYQMYDSNYIVYVSKEDDGMAAFNVYDKKTGDYVFTCMNKNVIKEFVKFHKKILKATMKEVIMKKKSEVEAKKAEEEARKKAEIAAAKKAKLDQFLKESESKKKVNESIVDDESLEWIKKLSKQYDYPELVAQCAERLVAAQAIKLMSGRSYADREMREIQKKFPKGVIDDAWDVKFELEDRLSNPEYGGRQNESLNEDLSFAAHDLVIAVLGAVSIIATPWITRKLAQRVDAKKLRAAQEEARKSNALKKKILTDTVFQLQKDKEFKRLLKDVESNPVEGKKDMFLKGRRMMPGKPLAKQPIRKDRFADYQAMQNARGSAIDQLQKYLNEILSEEQKTVFEDLLKTYRVHPPMKESVEEMPESDKKLLAQAKLIDNPIDWSLVYDLEEKAVSSEAKEILHKQAMHLYHQEEGDSI